MLIASLVALQLSVQNALLVMVLIWEFVLLALPTVFSVQPIHLNVESVHLASPSSIMNALSAYLVV